MTVSQNAAEVKPFEATRTPANADDAASPDRKSLLTIETVILEFRSGALIEEAVRTAYALARDKDCEVVFEFNGVIVYVDSTVRPFDVIQRYFDSGQWAARLAERRAAHG